MTTELQDCFDRLAQLRRNDDGSSLMMKELERILQSMTWETHCERNKRQLAELEKKGNQ